jgi:hypothetical protein
MSKTAKQQYLDNKPIYMYEDNVLFGIIRLGNIVGFDTNNGIKKSVGFFLYIKGDIPFHYDIKLRSEKDTPEKYFLDIVDGKVDKIHTNLSLL